MQALKAPIHQQQQQQLLPARSPRPCSNRTSRRPTTSPTAAPMASAASAV